ncbi:patatin-like phospholipase family protein [Chengkuizengella sediminis]|uniref:patatin-like phospholipase family protein n=1 Tax=Chengkuizengella sediminis TaxID=1885917 RepID=UPI0013894A2E|nr:patatin family protein [Chengkuizengella sediminis]NDI33262.1 patatin family protein [Chengkuizengella sediminis]
MTLDNIGLVLEGGGLRGVYTAGILDYFIKKELTLPYIIGASAGACNATSYISKQYGRNKKVTIDYIDYPGYISVRNLITKRSLFGMDIIFDELPNKHEPFDYDAFHSSPQTFKIVVTDCVTGKPIYFDKNEEPSDVFTLLKASISLPLITQVVEHGGYKLLDGGIADPIPLKKSIEDGNKRNIVILTRNKGYEKKPASFRWMLKARYRRKYKGLVDTMINRHIEYNATLQFVNHLEEKGDIFVFRPEQPLQVNRLEKDKIKLTLLYEQGIEDAKKQYDQLLNWIEKTE